APRPVDTDGTPGAKQRRDRYDRVWLLGQILAWQYYRDNAGHHEDAGAFLEGGGLTDLNDNGLRIQLETLRNNLRSLVAAGSGLGTTQSAFSMQAYAREPGQTPFDRVTVPVRQRHVQVVNPLVLTVAADPPHTSRRMVTFSEAGSHELPAFAKGESRDEHGNLSGATIPGPLRDVGR